MGAMDARITAAELDAMEARIAAAEARLARGRAVGDQEKASEPAELADLKLLLALRTFADLNQLSEQGHQAVQAYLDARLVAMEARVAELEKRVEPPPAA